MNAPRRFAAAMAGLGVTLALAACGDDPSSSGANKGPGDPLVIGVVSALSGFAAPYDLPPVNGLEVAVDELNERGGILGRQVEVVTYDIKEDPGSGVAGAQDVIAKGADVVVVSCDFDRGSPAAFTAAEAGKLTISTCAASVKFGPQVISPLAFTMATGAPGVGSIMAEWLHEQGLRRPYVLEDTQFAYSKDITKYFGERWAELGGAPAGQDTYKFDDKSVAAQISKMRSTEFDSIMLGSAGPPSGATVLRQIRAAGIDVPVIAGEAMDGDYWLKSVPNLSDFYFVTYGSIFGDDGNPKVNDFFKTVTERDGKQLGSFSLPGYSVAEAYAKAVEQAGSTDAEKVQKALETFDAVELLTGATSFTPELHMSVQRPMAIMQVQDDKMTFLERRGATQTPPIDLGS